MTPTEMETILVEVALHVRQLQTDVKDMGGRLERVETRLDGVEERLGGVEGRLEGVDGRLEGVEGRLGSVETNVASIAADVKNLDLRTTRIEDILPTLATKEDLAVVGTRIDDARREARVLFEDVRGDIRMLAEHVARLSGRRDR